MRKEKSLESIIGNEESSRHERRGFPIKSSTSSVEIEMKSSKQSRSRQLKKEYIKDLQEIFNEYINYPLSSMYVIIIYF